MEEQQTRYTWFIVKSGSVSLVAGDTYVKALSNRLGWKEETLIKRVQAVLPRKLDQELFLAMTVEMQAPIHPETFQKIYHYFTDGQWISLGFDREMGNNLYLNRSERILHQIDLTLNILHWGKEEGFLVSWLCAAHLVQAYGDDAEEILCVIMENLDEIIEERNMIMPRKKAFATIAFIVANNAANAEEGSSAPNIASAEDILELLSPIPARWSEDGGEDV